MADKDLSASEDVRRLTPAELRKLNKDQLQFALRTLINETTEDTAAGPTVVQMGRIEAKLDEFLTKWNKEKEAMQKEIKELRRDKDKMIVALGQHQKMLEAIEAERRAANLIITGVPEDNMGGATTDRAKVNLVLATMGQSDVPVKSVERLGNQRQDGRAPAAGGSRPYRRPIKVVLANTDDRKTVLENAHQLKTKDAVFRSIYVKKDVHPIVRKELDRLRDATKREKERPENQGKNVRYDYRERKVYVDDVVVDSYQVTSF